ncbi:ribosomal RNA processing protein 36 homolog [Micropterus salmoides]|uniref:ribosomal RNA processing protein 36 homolog n=1 Tax=Micropterus salmoides TaxID=27706 RepID=UPI0018EBDD8F|nr:ribosomal RNA processing protein 36 homolog [Micropterus salmoides]XP_038589741.1 ribosomal RNA processing protein 36 homolog [Micropterus salmoides]XP_038589750.1 ribosomal RNA processing protein 36 homolog [Micropterus salmoides]
MMAAKEKQRRELAVSKKKNMVASSSDDEDSDVEKNFALLTKRGGTEEGEQYNGGEEAFSDDDDEEDEDGSNGGNEDDENEEDLGEEASDDGEVEEEVEGGEEEDGGREASEEEEEDEEDEDGEDAGGSGGVQTREDIKNELSNMSFEDIMKLQNKVGTKVYNEVAYGSSKSGESRKKKRLNKNRPMEISAKRPVPFLRQVVPVRKPTLRDPRFDDLSGEYNPEIFEKTYKFIDEIKHREKQIIQKQLKKTKKNNQRKEKLQFLLKRMENQERAKKSREQQRERELQFKRQQRERANQGTGPFFLKNSEKKKLQLAEKYQELKKSGKLENFLSKKRKRNAGKDRRKLPDTKAA